MWTDWKPGQIIDKPDELLKYLKKPVVNVIYGVDAVTITWNLPPFGAVASQVAEINNRGELVFVEENLMQMKTFAFAELKSPTERKFVIRARNNMGVGEWSEPVAVSAPKPTAPPVPAPTLAPPAAAPAVAPIPAPAPAAPPATPARVATPAPTATPPTVVARRTWSISLGWRDMLGVMAIIAAACGVYQLLQGNHELGLWEILAAIVLMTTRNIHWQGSLPAIRRSGAWLRRSAGILALIAGVGLLLWFALPFIWKARPWANVGTTGRTVPSVAATSGSAVGINNGTINNNQFTGAAAKTGPLPWPKCKKPDRVCDLKTMPQQYILVAPGEDVQCNIPEHYQIKPFLQDGQLSQLDIAIDDVVFNPTTENTDGYLEVKQYRFRNESDRTMQISVLMDPM